MTHHETSWRKSTFSGSQGDCVELANIGESIGLRDSKDPQGPILHFTRAEMSAFIAGCKDGQFDDLA